MTSQLVNNTINQQDVCVPVPQYEDLWFNVIPIIEILVNIFVIIAALQNRRRLRHNFVYIYVINTLVANTFFGLAVLYGITNDILYMERVWGSEHSFNLIYDHDASRVTLRNWFAFRTAFTVSLFLVMSGSISALIYGIRDSSYFVGRRFTHRSSEKSLKVKSITKRRTKMIVIIILNWVIPFLLAIVPAAGWNCAHLCICVPGYYGPNVPFCQTNIHRECSRFLQPQRHGFLVLTVVIWLVESCGMVYMLITMWRKYFKVTRTRKPPSSRVFSDEPTTTNSFENIQLSRQLTLVKPRQNDDKDDDVFKESCIRLPSLSYHVKLLLIISITFVIFTLPSMVVIIIDASYDNYALGVSETMIPPLLCLGYCIIAPIVLVVYMPGLRLALKRTFFKCKCCTKTTLSTTASVSSGTDG